MYGDYLGEYKGRKYYSFPSPEKLSKARPEDLREKARVGFRDKRIVQTAKLINDGFFDFENDIKMPTEDLRKKLQELPGVGPKVADCILLFAFHKRETFPVDVWIKRVMEFLFIKEEVPKNKFLPTPTNILEKMQVMFNNIYSIMAEKTPSANKTCNILNYLYIYIRC